MVSGCGSFSWGWLGGLIGYLLLLVVLFVFTVRCGGFVLVLAVGLAVYVGLFYFVSFRYCM